jgi:GNAT superfamily N-acetyltransferase
MPSSTDAVTIRPIEGWWDRKRFVDVPYEFYPGRYPRWVPPLRRDVTSTLDPSANAFFEHGDMQLFLAEDASGAAVGRIAGIVNGMHLQKYDDATGFFGFFECVEDYAVAEALLDAAAEWGRRQGLRRMRGPANPSLNDTAGLLVDGFQFYPSLLMPYNPPYHHDFLRRYGFERIMTMWSFYAHIKYAKTDRLRRGTRLATRRTPGLALRTLNMDRFEADVQAVREIYNDAWSDNWGHVPMTEGEFEQLVDELEQIVDPNMVFFVEDDGRPVGFSVSLPDVNEALRHVPDGRLFPLGLPKLLLHAHYSIDTLRMPLMGIRPEYRGKGLDAMLILATMDAAPEHGYVGCETSWILDTNDRLLNMIETIGATQDKEYALFEVPISDGA